jgi:hypothetical protein
MISSRLIRPVMPDVPDWPEPELLATAALPFTEPGIDFSRSCAPPPVQPNANATPADVPSAVRP